MVKKRIAIIGGGISGLASAYFLQQAAGEKAEILLFESKSRLGGVIETEITRDGFILEGGPDCFLSKKPGILEFCKKLGLDLELIPTRESCRRSAIYLNGKLITVPQGFYLTAPARLSTLALTSLLSVFGKLRAALDLFIPARQNSSEESIAQFLRRRLGREVFEKIGQPMIGGIYGGDPEKISLRATLPQFEEMEKKFGSIIRGIRHLKEESTEQASGPRYNLFFSFRQGMEQLVRALVLELNKVKIYTACKITSLKRARTCWELETEEGRFFEADIVLIALPAFAAAGLTNSFAPALSEKLSAIPYESMATVSLLYRKSDIGSEFKGMGFVVPKKENLPFSACTFSSYKFEGRTPEDHVLLRAFVGGALYHKEWELDDTSLEQAIHQDLARILKIAARPQKVSIRRLPKSMPQYWIGHQARVSAIYQELKTYPGLYLTGNAYEGVGIPDCIEHARQSANSILSVL